MGMKEYLIWLLKVVTMLVLFIVVVPALIMAVGAVTEAGTDVAAGDKAVAVVELKGEIVDTKEIISQLYKQAFNHKVDGIVLRIDSPGGGVGASQDVYTAVRQLKERKPIVVSMGGLAASGGLYSAVGASKIYAQPGTLTGSIGVIMQVPNFTKVTEKVGVNVITLKSGRLKDAGNPFREMLPEEEKYLETTLHSVHQDFMQAISEGRGIPVEEVAKFADGRVITGRTAKELKLVDEFGNLYDAARAVYELKGQPLPADTLPKLLYPQGKFSQFRELLAWVSSIPKMFSTAQQVSYLMQ